MDLNKTNYAKKSILAITACFTGHCTAPLLASSQRVQNRTIKQTS